MSKKDLLWILNGGTGNQIMRTALLPELKELYNDIYIIASYADVFQMQNDVESAWGTAQASIYEQLIKNNDNLKIVAENPYNVDSFITKKCHFFDACRITLGLDIKGTEFSMKQHASLNVISAKFPNVTEDAEKNINELLKKHNKKDVVLIQSAGGQSPLGSPKDVYSLENDPLIRHYKHFPELMTLLAEEYPDTLFLQYRLKNEPELPNTVMIEKPYLEYHEIAKFCKGAIVIDSSLQHIIAGVCPTAVLWGETRPENFGYSFNKNIDFAKNNLDTEPYFQIFQNKPAVVKYKSVEDILSEIKEWNFGQKS